MLTLFEIVVSKWNFSYA